MQNNKGQALYTQRQKANVCLGDVFCDRLMLTILIGICRYNTANCTVNELIYTQACLLQRPRLNLSAKAAGFPKETTDARAISLNANQPQPTQLTLRLGNAPR